MDWLDVANLYDKFHKIENGGPPYDFDNLLIKMMQGLRNGLREFNYPKKTKIEKNRRDSTNWREQGNRIFTSSSDADSLAKALEFYTKCIAFAIPGSEEMALGFANRSAVLFKLNFTNECLEDIERALELDYPERSMPKIYIRMAECYTKLATDCYIDAKVWLNKIPNNNNQRSALFPRLASYPNFKESDRILDEECIIPEIKKRSKKFSCASDAVDVKTSEKFGRHFVATRDINVGEVLVVEKPYFNFLYPQNLYTHCSYCMTFVLAGIPCDECVNSVYCSEKCKLKAWDEYHELECSLFDFVIQYGCFLAGGRPVRLLMQFYKEAGGMQQLKERVYNLLGPNMDKLVLDIKEEWYEKNSLESTLSLLSHEDKMKNNVCRIVTSIVVRMLFYMITHTNIFGVQYNPGEMYDVNILSAMLTNPDVIFIGKLLIKLGQIIGYNSYKSTEYNSGSTADRGSVALPFLNLINHSCSSNTYIQFKKEKSVLYAVFPIKKDEQIFTSYFQSYATATIDIRRSFLQEEYNFICDCNACLGNWPLLDESSVKMDLAWTKVKPGPGREKVKKIVQVFLNLVGSVMLEMRLDANGKQLEQLYKSITVFYQEIGLPSSEITVILRVILSVYNMTGNTAKIQSRFALKDRY